MSASHPCAVASRAIRRRSLPILAAGLATPAVAAPAWSARGIASWYGPGFNGRRMANGEIFDQESVSAAHRSLPFRTRLLVRNLDSGLESFVLIEDRGPFIAGRILDVSRGSARRLGFLERGLARVEIRIA